MGLGILMLSIIIGGVLTRAIYGGSMSAKANWEQKQQRAAEKQEARRQEAADREQRWNEWVNTSIAKGWRHPLWWPYAAAWTVGSGINGGVAAYRGARAALSPESRKSARDHAERVGRAAAQNGTGLLGTVKEWHAQRKAHEDQQRRRAQHDGRQCSTCDQNDPDMLVTVGDGSTVCLDCLRKAAWERHRKAERPHRGTRRCADCGVDDENLLTEDNNVVLCVPCLLKRQRARQRRAGEHDQPTPPVMVRCVTCGAVITRLCADINQGRCASCAGDREAAAGGDHGSGAVWDADEDPNPPSSGSELVEPRPALAASGDTTRPEPDREPATPANDAVSTGTAVRPGNGATDDATSTPGGNHRERGVDSTQGNTEPHTAIPVVTAGNGSSTEGAAVAAIEGDNAPNLGVSGDASYDEAMQLANRIGRAVEVMRNSVSGMVDGMNAYKVGPQTQKKFMEIPERLQDAFNTAVDASNFLESTQGPVRDAYEDSNKNEVARNLSFFD